MPTLENLTAELTELNQQMAAAPEATVTSVTRRDQFGRIEEVTAVKRGMGQLLERANEVIAEMAAVIRANPDTAPAAKAKAGLTSLDTSAALARWEEAEFAKAGFNGKAQLGQTYDAAANMIDALESIGYRVLTH